MPVPAPTAETRWRCTLCGNLTRFDVRRSTRATEFVHVTLAGEQVVEERSVLADTIEHVTCRWCGRVDAVELIPRADATGPAAGGPGGGAPGGLGDRGAAGLPDGGAGGVPVAGPGTAAGPHARTGAGEVGGS